MANFSRERLQNGPRAAYPIWPDGLVVGEAEKSKAFGTMEFSSWCLSTIWGTNDGIERLEPEIFNHVQKNFPLEPGHSLKASSFFFFLLISPCSISAYDRSILKPCIWNWKPIAGLDSPVLVRFSWGLEAPGAQQVKASAPSDYLSQLKTLQVSDQCKADLTMVIVGVIGGLL